MLGDLNIAEPARLSVSPVRASSSRPFTEAPRRFQRSEFLLEHGFLDAVVHRKELKSFISNSLDLLLT